MLIPASNPLKSRVCIPGESTGPLSFFLPVFEMKRARTSYPPFGGIFLLSVGWGPLFGGEMLPRGGRVNLWWCGCQKKRMFYPGSKTGPGFRIKLNPENRVWGVFWCLMGDQKPEKFFYPPKNPEKCWYLGMGFGRLNLGGEFKTGKEISIGAKPKAPKISNNSPPPSGRESCCRREGKRGPLGKNWGNPFAGSGPLPGPPVLKGFLF